MAEDINHPSWCTEHWFPTELDPSSWHQSAPIHWGGGDVRLVDDGKGPRVYVNVSVNIDFDISPDAARLLASALLDAANLAQPGIER
jgi:hypothetical protein